MNSHAQGDALPEGYRLHWYEIGRVLGRGGFGITYLATDTNLDRAVAIKEFLPLTLAVRERGVSVRPTMEDRAALYDWGRERFLTEAKTLAKFMHPNIVRVNAVFEANNTAYMVMDYEQGDSLDDLLKFGRIDAEDRLLALLGPLLDGLEYIHAAGFIHRDIKPANIHVRSDGSPVLLDFGSARCALGDETRTLTAVVSPGFAPYEQYQPDAGRQGPWTDVYGLGATLYAALNRGRGPIDAMARIHARIENEPDPLHPAAELGKARYSTRFLDAVDAALGFTPEERPSTVAAWRVMFPRPGAKPAESAPGSSGKPSVPQTRAAQAAPVPAPARPLAAFVLVAVLAAGFAAGGWWYLRESPTGAAAALERQPGADVDTTVAVRAGPSALAGAAREGSNDVATVTATRTDLTSSTGNTEPERPGARGPGSRFREILEDGSAGPEMVVMAPGRFVMGSPAGEAGRGVEEGPQYPVTFTRPFAIGAHEVTFDDYDRFAAATLRRRPDDHGFGRGRRPVLDVSFDDAAAYANWLSLQTGTEYRLPSEAEWEYAARAGTTSARPWGEDAAAACRHANVYDNSGMLANAFNWTSHACDDGFAVTAPVGSRSANAFGLHDLLGNVWEWTADCWNESLAGAPPDGSARTTGDCARRAGRGGSWSTSPVRVRSAFRAQNATGARNYALGFRLAASLPTPAGTDSAGTADGAAAPGDRIGILAPERIPAAANTATRVFLRLPHLRQESNLCVPTSAAMVLAFFDDPQSPRKLKVLSRGKDYSPDAPFNDFTFTWWRDLLAGMTRLGYDWYELSFGNDDAGFRAGLDHVRTSLRRNRPVLVDVALFGSHTFVIVGFDDGTRQVFAIDPNLPPPAVRALTHDQLASIWNGVSYGLNARPAMFTRRKQG